MSTNAIYDTSAVIDEPGGEWGLPRLGFNALPEKVKTWLALNRLRIEIVPACEDHRAARDVPAARGWHGFCRRDLSAIVVRLDCAPSTLCHEVAHAIDFRLGNTSSGDRWGRLQAEWLDADEEPCESFAKAFAAWCLDSTQVPHDVALYFRRLVDGLF